MALNSPKRRFAARADYIADGAECDKCMKESCKVSHRVAGLARIVRLVTYWINRLLSSARELGQPWAACALLGPGARAARAAARRQALPHRLDRQVPGHQPG